MLEFSRKVPIEIPSVTSRELKTRSFRLSFTAGVTVNEEAGKQDSVVEQYLCPRPSISSTVARCVPPSLPPFSRLIPHPPDEAKWTLVEAR